MPAVHCGAAVPGSKRVAATYSSVETPIDNGSNAEVTMRDAMRRNRASSSPSNAMRWIAARSALREILGGCLDADPRALVFAYGDKGKPALAEPAGEWDLQFSLAHSAHLAVYAVTVGCPVGVDLERMRPLPDMDRIAERTFSRQECAALRALPATLRPSGFFNCWTRKEAYIKAVGLGLSYPLERFTVSLAPGAPARLETVEAEPGHVEGWTMAALAPRSGFVGAVVVGARPVDVVCERWGEDRR